MEFHEYEILKKLSLHLNSLEKLICTEKRDGEC